MFILLFFRPSLSPGSDSLGVHQDGNILTTCPVYTRDSNLAVIVSADIQAPNKCVVQVWE